MLCRVLIETYQITEQSVMMSGITDNILDLGLYAHGATLHLFNSLFSLIPLEAFCLVFHKLKITHGSTFFAEKPAPKSSNAGWKFWLLLGQE